MDRRKNAVVWAVLIVALIGESAGSSDKEPRQLHAVRGEVVKIARNGKGSLSITVRPARDFSEATVTARENEWVGSAATRDTDADLLGLLTGDDARHDDRITTAELEEGDIVSVIYDPANQNRSLEIYLH